MDTNTPVTQPTQPRRAASRSFRTPVRGHAFASRPGAVPDPYPGQPALLVREPGNPADPLAVAVWVEDGTVPWRIGYLDRGVSARVAPRLDRGQRIDARLDGWSAEPEGRWRRPVLLLRAVPDPSVPDPSVPDPRPSGSAASPPVTGKRSHAPKGDQDAQVAPAWGRPPGVVRRRLPRRA